jgi:two-component system nitrate/nitrite response regulator NarL
MMQMHQRPRPRGDGPGAARRSSAGHISRSAPVGAGIHKAGEAGAAALRQTVRAVLRRGELPAMTDVLDGFALLLVDDHPLFREGLVLALGARAPGLSVVAVDGGDTAWALLQREPSRFDLVVLDHRLREAPLAPDGLAWAARLRQRFPALACALMSGSEAADLPERARGAGLVGFLPKSLDVTQLLQALAAVAQGHTWFAAPRAAPEAALNPPALTPRQREIVALAAAGATSKEIGRRLGISPATVRNHFAQVFERLGARSRAQAVQLAQQAYRVAWPAAAGLADDARAM